MNPIAFTYDWGLTTDTSRVNQAKLVGSCVEHIIRAANIKQKKKLCKKQYYGLVKKTSFRNVACRFRLVTSHSWIMVIS